jgi:hypothetical protein
MITHLEQETGFRKPKANERQKSQGKGIFDQLLSL